MRLRFRGSRVIARLEARRLVVRADPAVDLVLAGRSYTVDAFGVELERVEQRWRKAR
jgi:hypothetical protein